MNRRPWLRFVALLACCGCLAPTPGDIGGCQPVRPLDETAFFDAKRRIDCERCSECGLHTRACERACDDEALLSERFPEGCEPLTHDGAVCLRALLHVGCGDFSAFVRDRGATLPTECDFCPEEARP